MENTLDLNALTIDCRDLPDYGFCVGYCHWQHDNDLGDDGSDNPDQDQADSDD